MESKRYLSIEEKIEEARALYEASADRLRRDGRIRDLLTRLEQNIGESMQAMRAFRVVQTCKWCEEQEGGSCCGAGIENRYEPLQLLINLLLDVSLPDRQKYPDSCYFLETDGCSLKARHVLCVNYLCKKLQQSLSVDELNILQATLGEELDTGFALHEAIRKELGRDAGDR
jgi:hypothetical protein